ncbi:MAG: fructose-bisphosphate aldolase [candidate division NC10 bacterium]|nr:fructose-bisphosphate aldolase [candidate division NC10 bacterium]MBI3086863.1 fructose-bisphosphate aldolase [candidate division NC10 bacterium]MBI3121325.1 fructose-bisphosphate aldolase [candidate division NC10 bacterium]
MSTSQLALTARALVAAGKGLLAADESAGTIAKRFDAVGIEHTASMEDETFELGSGIYITAMLPEESAAFIREFIPRRDTGPR